MTETFAPNQRDAERFAAITALDLLVSQAFAKAWANLDAASLQLSFTMGVLPDLLATMITAQETAAGMAADYANAEAIAQGASSTPIVNAEMFSGVSSSGGPLTGLLAQPLVRTYAQSAAGMPAPQALAAGGTLLDGIGVTQVHDAARAGEFTAIAANAEVAGYLRVVEPGACSRCILLSGKFYRWNAGFRRHPRCRCSHRLQLKNDTPPPDPKDIFDKMPKAEQDRVFTPDSAQAIRDGADIYQIVNARQGMSTATVAGQTYKTTSQGTTAKSYMSSVRRAIAAERGVRYRRQPRLMPEELARLSKGNQAEMRRLLINNGYIVGDIQALAAEAVAAAPHF